MRLLIFGGTGFCGRAMVERALQFETLSSTDESNKDAEDDSSRVEIKVTLFVRDEECAKSLFSNNKNLKERSLSTKIQYILGDIYSPSDVKEALINTEPDAIISCLSSYRHPHDQMSVLTQNILSAINAMVTATPVDYDAQQTRKFPIRFVHFGYPRGEKDHGTRLENGIVKMTEVISCTKYGPAIRDHKAVYELLQEWQTMHEQSSSSSVQIQKPLVDYALFAAPKMVDRTTTKAYYGKHGSVDSAIQSARVWHFVSTRDAADLILSHLVRVVSADEQHEQLLLPKLLCLFYK